MKHISLIVLSLLIFQSAQAQRDKEFQIRAGLGFGIYGTKSEYGNDKDKVKDTGGALTLYLPLDFRYEITRRFNMGLDMKVGSYLYDPDSADGKSNSYIILGVGAELNIKTENDFRWYAGAGLNIGSLVLEETNRPSGNVKKQEWTYSGVGVRINTGVLIYVIKDFGLNFNLGFDSHSLNLQRYKQDGTKVNLDNFDAKLKLNGVDGTIGLVYRFSHK